jgi:hypothetical protein
MLCNVALGLPPDGNYSSGEKSRFRFVDAPDCRPKLCRFCIRLCQIFCRALPYNLAHFARCSGRDLPVLRNPKATVGKILFRQIDRNLLTVVLHGKAHRPACLNR